MAGTRDREISCDECLAGMAEFAEYAESVELSAVLVRVRDHLELCPECKEEYTLLLAALESTPPSRA